MYDDTTKVEFSKTDITGDKEVPGCELEVTDNETGKVMDQWTSTKHKHVIEGKYVVGKTYVMTEKRPADGFVTASDVEFTVSDTGEVQGVSMKDDTTKIEFSKIASDTKKLLPGAKYGVYDSKGKKVYEFTTSDKAVMIDGILKAGETYTFVEEQAPEHYKKAKDVKITVKDTGKVQKVKAVDERIRRYLTHHRPEQADMESYLHCLQCLVCLQHTHVSELIMERRERMKNKKSVLKVIILIIVAAILVIIAGMAVKLLKEDYAEEKQFEDIQKVLEKSDDEDILSKLRKETVM